jgi:hypothetical protein
VRFRGSRFQAAQIIGVSCMLGVYRREEASRNLQLVGTDHDQNGCRSFHVSLLAGGGERFFARR